MARPPAMSMRPALIMVPVAISRGVGVTPPSSMRAHSRFFVLNNHASPNALHPTRLSDVEDGFSVSAHCAKQLGTCHLATDGLEVRSKQLVADPKH